MKPVVTILSNGLDTGDWYAVKLQDKIFCQGHSITIFDWMNLLEYLGTEVEEKRNLTNDELEKRTIWII